MAFSRNSLVAAVAGTLSLALMTGCPNPNQPAPTQGGASPGTTPVGGASPGTTPVGGASPGTTPVGGASGAPNPSASVNQGTAFGVTNFQGDVFDEENTPVSGARVRVQSLAASAPYDQTFETINGNYSATGVPAGPQLRVTVTKEGFTTRERVVTVQTAQGEQRVEIDFGGTEDAQGAAYYISERPEITAVEPAEDATNVDPSKVTVRLTLSEALDEDSQDAFIEGIRVFPADDEALMENSTGATDLEDSTEGLEYNVDTEAPYFISENSLFLGDTDTEAEASFNAEGTVATLTFNAPLKTSNNEAVKYQIGVVNTGEVLEDEDGEDLGMGSNGEFGGYAGEAPGTLILNIFREVTLGLNNVTTATAEERWQQTHESVSTFETAEDDTDPTLTAVDVSNPGTITRIELTFSEPMAAYGGSDEASAIVDTTVLDLGSYTFAVAETQQDLDDVTLEGDTGNTAGATVGNADLQEEFTLEGGALTATASINPDDAREVRIDIPEGDFFVEDANFLKVRAEVADPAGNLITEINADREANQPSVQI